MYAIITEVSDVDGVSEDGAIRTERLSPGYQQSGVINGVEL